MKDYEIFYYEIWIGPDRPDEHGTYYGKTPILEQAEGVMECMREKGISTFLKAACSDGKIRYVL